MSWNYRIIRKKSEFGYHYDLHEVYYNKRKQPTSWTVDPIDLAGFDTPDEMMYALANMMIDSKRFRILEEQGKKLVEIVPKVEP